MRRFVRRSQFVFFKFFVSGKERRLAFGAYQALAAYGRRIPEDVSVVSFDNEQVTPYLRPGLTTVEIPYLEMGRRAMELVLGAEAPTGRHLIGMPLRERGSVRPVS